MARNLQWKRRALLLSLAFLLLAPFSNAIPCFKIPSLEPLARLLSISMETIPFIIYSIILATYSYLREGKDKARNVVVGAIAVNLLALFFKFLFRRPRPIPEGTPGYPSGHSARAVWLAIEMWKRNRALGSVMFAYALGVMWSRVELCAHYPLDVVGGLLLAVIVEEVLG